MRLRLNLALIATGASLALAQADPIDDLVKANMAKDSVPGLALALINPKGEVEYRAYGKASLEWDVPVNSKTVFRWASMSKQFCAASILMLEAEGKLKTTDKLLTHLPEGPAEWKDITLQHILNHLSGLETPEGQFLFTRDYTWPQYIELVSKSPLPSTPGTKFAYSNPGYSLLGAVVEKVSGLPLADFVKKNIFDVYGMTSARYYKDGEVVPNRAGGYRIESGKAFNALFDRPTVYGGSGGIMGSLEDLVAWDAALRTGKFPKTIQAKMAIPGKLNDGKTTEYGCGWFLRKEGESQIQHHSGGTNGFTSFQLRDVTLGHTVFVLRNSGMGTAVNLGIDIYTQIISGKKP